MQSSPAAPFPFLKPPPITFSKWGKILAGALALYFFVHGFFLLAQVFSLKYFNPGTTAFMKTYLTSCTGQKNGCPFEQSWKPLNEISKKLQEAVLISEDDSFFEHEGIDTEAIKQSIEVNLKKKKIVRGASTITQQLAKNLYFTASKNPIRKINEILIALLMEKLLSKQRILEIYLNVIEWGKGIYGAQEAALYYFNKPVKSLSSDEAAYLAAIIPNPVFLTDKKHAGRAQRRKNIILRRMTVRNFEEL